MIDTCRRRETKQRSAMKTIAPPSEDAGVTSSYPITRVTSSAVRSLLLSPSPPLSSLLFSSLLSFPCLSFCLSPIIDSSFSVCEPVFLGFRRMEQDSVDEEDSRSVSPCLETVAEAPVDEELVVVRANSGASSLFGSEDSRSTTSSSDISGSSGEIPAAVVADAVVPRLSAAAPPADADVAGGLKRETCVGRSRPLTWGKATLLGRRREMEDAVAVVRGFMSRTCEVLGGCTAPGSRSSVEVAPVHFFGVYDGHGGSQVARFCAEHIHDSVAAEWDKGTGGEAWRRRWEEAFSRGFEKVDSEVNVETVAPEMVGSTAVVVVVSGCQIIASNCGDSRAILCRGSRTIPLTIDHKPDREDELLRIEGGGGRVINWNGPRVFGVLAMSRAIGDRYLKPWIIAVPEVTFTTRSEEDECLIVASDGLWDVMSNDEAGEVACLMLRRHRRRGLVDHITSSPAQATAEHLVDLAYRKNSSDNISVIVVDLKSKRKRQQRQ